MTNTEIKKGDTFTITHSDNKAVTEVVSKIERVREVNRVNVYHHIRINDIVRHYNEVSKYTLVVCESGACYDVKEINN